jgi:hypothetical protein
VNAPARGFSRRALGLWAGLALTLGARTVWAGTYLNRAAVLLSGGAREAAYLRARLGDRELAGVVHRLAQARVATAGAMTVPKEVAQAHPHLLLVLENYEQATDAATRGELERFTICYQRAQDEDRTFRAIVKSLGWVVGD